MKRKKQKQKQGITLIETLVSMLVMVMLVIGGSATLAFSGSMVIRQESQRTALAAATAVMEENIQGIGVAGLGNYTTTNNGYTVMTDVATPGDGFAYVRVRVVAGTPAVSPFTLCYRVYE